MNSGIDNETLDGIVRDVTSYVKNHSLNPGTSPETVANILYESLESAVPIKVETFKNGIRSVEEYPGKFDNLQLGEFATEGLRLFRAMYIRGSRRNDPTICLEYVVPNNLVTFSAHPHHIDYSTAMNLGDPENPHATFIRKCYPEYRGGLLITTIEYAVNHALKNIPTTLLPVPDEETYFRELDEISKNTI